MPVSVLPAPPTNAPPSSATPSNAISPFTRGAPPTSPALPSTGSSVPQNIPTVPAVAAGSSGGAAIGLGPAVLGAGLGVAAGLGAASQLSGVSPGDILKQSLREVPGFDPAKNYDPARFGLPTLPDLSGVPLPRRNPDGTPSPGALPRGGIPQRNTPQQPTYPFTGGQEPGRNYFVPYSYTVPGTVQNGGGNPVLPGPIGGIITTGGGGVINYYIQHGGGQYFLLTASAEQPAKFSFGNVRPVDGNPDGPGNPPALFVPTSPPSPFPAPNPVPPATPSPGPPPEKSPQPKPEPKPFSEPVPFPRRRPAEPVPPEPVPNPEPSPPEREPDRAPPPSVPAPARPSPGPGPAVTPRTPGTVPPLEPAPKFDPFNPPEKEVPQSVPGTYPATPPLFDPLPSVYPSPSPDTTPVKPATPNDPVPASGVPPLPPSIPGSIYPGRPEYDKNGDRTPPAQVPPIVVPPNTPRFAECCDAILAAIRSFRQSAEDKLEANQTSLEELEKYCIPIVASPAEISLTACTNSGVVQIGTNTYAIRFNSCETDNNVRSEFGGTGAPNVDYLGWYSFSSTIYGGGDRKPISYKEQVVYPPSWARFISFTYKGSCTGQVFQRYLIASGIEAEFQAERLFRKKA